jgi:SPP1 gp7 family putative phage head morphogenesis protein
LLCQYLSCIFSEKSFWSGMPSERSRKPLLSLAIRRQVLLERIKAGQVRDFSAIFPEIETLLIDRVNRLPNDLRGENRAYVTKWLNQLDTAVKRQYGKQIKLFRQALEETAGLYAVAEASDIASSITGQITLAAPTAAQAWKYAQETAMGHSGGLLKDFIEELAGVETKRVINTIRQGYFQGRTNQQILRSVVGTRARRFQDGILNVSRRHAETMVRTSIQHVASTARQRTWEENQDIVGGYKWVSTLDSVTTTQCKALDGQTFKIGRGPVPPLHHRCRSATVATLKPKFDFLNEGQTRSAEFGPVDAQQNYYDWLKQQPESYQVEALGAQRAKLFREGGLSAERFRELQLDKKFDPLSLDEMRALEPEAFKRAGV